MQRDDHQDWRSLWYEGVCVVVRGYSSHVLRKVFGWVLGVPLLPLFAYIEFGEQGLAVRFIRFNNAFQFLHEQKLQHALICVQIHQLEQLPLQDVIIPERRNTGLP